MFSGEMASVYTFMANVPPDFEYAQAFSADPKILQFISIGAAPAGVLAAVSFILSRRHGSRHAGALIMGGGGALLAGMAACHSILPGIGEAYLSAAVAYVPYLFMALSAPVVLVGAYLFRRRAPPAGRRRPGADLWDRPGR